MIIIIINLILSLLSPLFSFYTQPNPSSLSSSSFCSSNSPFPLGSCARTQGEREREREREIKLEEARREAESSLEKESVAVKHFPSREIGDPTGLESDIVEIGG